MVIGLGTILTMGAMMLAGTGVKAQAPALYREGLAGSTQFTISLPVSRRTLLAVRAIAGLLEAAALTLITAAVTWTWVPVMRSAAAPADFARLVFTVLLFMTAPYCAVIFVTTLLEEPLSGVYAGYGITFLLWILHKAGPAVDVIRAWGAESPLITHRLPWTQLATMAVLALILFWAAVRSVEAREY
jgi:hypothetical protein